MEKRRETWRRKSLEWEGSRKKERRLDGWMTGVYCQAERVCECCIVKEQTEGVE